MKFVQDPPQNKTFRNIVLLVVFILLILALGLFGGCKSAEKRQAKLFSKFDKLKRKADADSVLKPVPPKWSLDNFPLTISKGKTVYLPGKKIPVPVHDTEYIQIDCDSAIKALGVGNGKVKIKPRDSIRVDTFYRVDSIVDPRPQALCNAEIKRLQTELSNQQALTQKAIDKAEIAQEKLNKRTGIMWWLIAVVLLLILWTFRRMFGIIR